MPRNRVTGRGSHNVICDVCGLKYKNSALKKRWDGVMVCEWDFETRHPQEFVRSRPDASRLPWTRTDADNLQLYTPTWGLIDSAGDLAVTGEYRTFDDTLSSGTTIVDVVVRATIGSTTTMNVGTWTITVPTANGGNVATGEAFVLVKGIQQVFGDVTLPAASSTCTIKTKGTGVQWSDAIPATWSEDDYFEMAIRYSSTS